MRIYRSNGEECTIDDTKELFESHDKLYCSDTFAGPHTVIYDGCDVLKFKPNGEMGTELIQVVDVKESLFEPHNSIYQIHAWK